MRGDWHKSLKWRNLQTLLSENSKSGKNIKVFNVVIKLMIIVNHNGKAEKWNMAPNLLHQEQTKNSPERRQNN